MSGSFVNEDGRIYELPRYVQRNCLDCHKPFLIADTDMSTFTCGMQDSLHKPFVYSPSVYRIDGPEAT